MNRLSGIICIIFFHQMAFAAPDSIPETSMTPEYFFNKAHLENLDELCRKFYHENIVFDDPIGQVKGLNGLIKYYQGMYQNVQTIRFESVNHFQKGDEQVYVWQMHLEHSGVGGGSPIVVDGVSLFRYEDNKVIYHRDYFDMGALIYERVPFLGSLITWIRQRAKGN